jgi:simple sugar transport system permease protein
MQDIPYIGKLLFSYNIFVYLGLIMIIGMHLFLGKTRKGLYLRSVGESPATADAAGINVTKYRYAATVIGGGISAIGGMVYTVTIAGTVWNHTGLSGEGWIAVALVIFCLWRPINSLWGSVLFGALLILYLRLPIPFIPTQIYKIVPYIVTALVLIMVSIRQRREDQPPAALGTAYFREDR